MGNKIGVAGVGLSEWWSDAEGGTVAELETRIPVRHYQVSLTCPVCKKGSMVYTGSYWPTGEPGYHHKCDGCGEVRAVRGETYPQIRTEPITPEIVALTSSANVP